MSKREVAGDVEKGKRTPPTMRKKKN